MARRGIDGDGERRRGIDGDGERKRGIDDGDGERMRRIDSGDGEMMRENGDEMATKKLAPRDRLELPTGWLTATCSTN